MSENNQVEDTDTSESQEVITLKPRSKPGPKTPELQEVTIQAKLVGRDKKPVVPEDVYKLSALGCTRRDIANYFGVLEDNISRHFAAELVKGREDMKISLRRAMLNNACQNNNAALQIFLAKNMLGMSDSPVDSAENEPLPWSDD